MSTTIYDTDNGCKRCLKSSPVPSLIGMVFVLLGGAAFGTGLIFGKNFLTSLIYEKSSKMDFDEISKYMDYTVFGLVGAIGLFTILSYLLCALSSGQNAKECFDTSGKSGCGRCCNAFLILCLFFGVLLWIGIVCLLSYTTISLAFLTHRQVKVGAANLDMNNVFPRSTTPATSPLPKQDDFNIGDSSEKTVLKDIDIDLSYYGIMLDGKETPIKSSSFDRIKEKLILCSSAATAGTLMMLFGYLMIIICVAMNYARLQEFRYYEIDNCNYDESGGLRS